MLAGLDPFATRPNVTIATETEASTKRRRMEMRRWQRLAPGIGQRHSAAKPLSKVFRASQRLRG